MGHLRKSTVTDLNYVIDNLRVLDKVEAWYQTGEQPEEAVRRTYLSSKKVMTIAGDDDQPMGLCGVIVNGVIWMVATEELFSTRKYKIQLIREGRKWIDNLLQKENVLYNCVYAENRSAIKWLKALGFTFVKLHSEYGHMKKPFFEFVRIA
jgi:ribosomal protein S18 acetylase RimI-like enzyme